MLQLTYRKVNSLIAHSDVTSKEDRGRWSGMPVKNMNSILHFYFTFI